jgi:hypothetical protein
VQSIERQLALGWPTVAIEFLQLYARKESELKRAGMIKVGRRLAEADWSRFAISLGAGFFQSVRDSKRAETLILEPPRRLNADLQWDPVHPRPLENVEDLFARGVCRVRHNLAHGEKFNVTGQGWDRDLALVTESKWVLQRLLA